MSGPIKGGRPKAGYSPLLGRQPLGDPRDRENVSKGISSADISAPLVMDSQDRATLKVNINGPLVVAPGVGLDLSVGAGLVVKKGSPPALQAQGTDSVIVNAQGIHARPSATQVRDDSGVGGGTLADTLKNRVELLERKGMANGYVELDARGKIPVTRGAAINTVATLDGNAQVPGDQLGGGTFLGAGTNVLIDTSPPTFAAVPLAALPAHHTTHETGGTDALTTLSAGILLSGTLPDARLSNTIAAAGPIGDATHTPAITYDAHGRLTTVSSVAITGTPPGGAAGGDLTGTYPNPTIAASAVTVSKMANMASKTILANITAGAAAPAADTLSQVLDMVDAAVANGDILYRTGGAWARLPIGTANQVLNVSGSTLPAWVTSTVGPLNGSAYFILDKLTVDAGPITSAATVDLLFAPGIYGQINGTTSITSFGSGQASIVRILKFDSVLTLTHNATSLILPGGANITTAAGDVAVMVSLGSGNWRCVNYMRAAAPPVSGTNTGDQTITFSGAVSGSGTGAITTSLSSFTSANLAAALTDETGSGAAVFATSPTLVTPLLGTPTSGTLTNCTGLPISSGVSGLGTGVATMLATPSSANIAAACTDETGSGALVFATSPTLVTPALGTPASGILTNCTNYPGAVLTETVYTSGTTFTTGANTKKILAIGVAAGGGGGGAAQTASQSAAGGGGGSGGFFQVLVAVTSSTSYSYAIGGGGAGGTAGANDGTAGGNTTLTIGATTYTANGASGGKGCAATATVISALGGAGGTAGTNGDLNGSGCAGGTGAVLSGSAAIAFSGQGGTSHFGGGGGGANTERAGIASGNYGGGGSGGVCLGTTARAGGAGKDGVLIVIELS